MGKVTRRRYSTDVKAKVALEAIKGEQATAELAARRGTHHMMIAMWKRQAIEGMDLTFFDKSTGTLPASAVEIDRLHSKIGQFVVERDFFVRASGRCVSSGGPDD